MERRVTTAVEMSFREFARTPVLIALLAFLPAYMIGVFVWLVPDSTIPLTVDGATVTAEMSAFAAAFMTPVTVAVLSGIVGLFLMQTSQDADSRLRLAGFRARELVTARLGLLTAGSVVITGASLSVALFAFTPENLAPFVGAAVLTGVTYGLLGVITGIVIDRLPGVYVMLFAPMVDILMFQNPLATESPSWTVALPGNFATDALMQAAFTSGVDLTDLLAAGGYVVALLSIGVVVFYRTTMTN
jgi:VIT1/CCC1 family predicted Fe2+/Mn2+ transporter